MTTAENACTSFWESSWKEMDPQRVAAYARQADLSGDPILAFLRRCGAVTVCDAGCGCGVFARALAHEGFTVSGFDVSAEAVRLANALTGGKADLRTADVTCTGYPDGAFDAVVCRDVVDHMALSDGTKAIAELLRIVRPGGCVVLTLDRTDDEYETEPHTVSPDGDYHFTAGKWQGMVFHPYTPEDVETLTCGRNARLLSASDGGFTVLLTKDAP